MYQVLVVDKCYYSGTFNSCVTFALPTFERENLVIVEGPKCLQCNELANLNSHS